MRSKEWMITPFTPIPMWLYQFLLCHCINIRPEPFQGHIDHNFHQTTTHHWHPSSCHPSTHHTYPYALDLKLKMHIPIYEKKLTIFKRIITQLRGSWTFDLCKVHSPTPHLLSLIIVTISNCIFPGIFPSLKHVLSLKLLKYIMRKICIDNTDTIKLKVKKSVQYNALRSMANQLTHHLVLYT